MAGCMSVVIAVVIGVPLGLVAGYFQKMWDGVISRFIEALLACPFLIMAIALGAFGPKPDQRHDRHWPLRNADLRPPDARR